MAPKPMKSSGRPTNGLQTDCKILESQTDPSPARHRARCGICAHPERSAIERAFLYREMSVAEITKRYGVGHDATYRHAHAMNLLPVRNRNWRAPIELDIFDRPTITTAVEPEPVVRIDRHSTPYARAIIELLQIPASDEVLAAIEQAVENKSERESTGPDTAANDIFISAALVKIARPPDSWLTWFQQLSADIGQTASHTT
jgi:hypothetical protein